MGLLTKGGRVDVERTTELVGMAKPLPVTFHRAFDECPNQPEALEHVVKSGAQRILTSGGEKTAMQGVTQLAVLVKAAGEWLTIIPGVGITAQNVAELARQTGASEFHAGLSSVARVPNANLGAFEEAVRQLSACLKEFSTSAPTNNPSEN